MDYNLLINGVYIGAITTFTNHLLSSWDIQVLPQKLTCPPWKIVAGRLLTILSCWNGPLFEDMFVFRGVWNPWKSNSMRNLKWFQVWIQVWRVSIKWSFQTWAVNHWWDADEHSHILIKTHELLSSCQPLILLMVQKSQSQPPGM